MKATIELPLTETSETTHDDLLMHYVNGAQRTVESVDQLGNFLMGFGVLALGYLLNADLSVATQALGVAPATHQVSALLTLGAWGVAVGLLSIFVWIFVSQVIVGRSVHAVGGNEDSIGQVMEAPEELSWRKFIRSQRSFREFLSSNYRSEDRVSPESLLYARWSYMRYMILQKLVSMERMRGLLGLALLFGVGFKVLLVYQTALAG